MSLDLTSDINLAVRTINQYILKNQPIPEKVLNNFNELINASLNTEILEKGLASSVPIGTPQGTLNSIFVDILTSNTSLLPASTSRNYILLQNIGSTNIYLSFGTDSAIGSGLLIRPGDFWSSQFSQFLSSSLFAIAVSSSSRLAIYTIDS